MYSLPDLETRAWTPASILSLAQSYRPRLSTADSAFVWVAFVGGCFQRDTGIDSSVIGVTLSGTGVIAVFKDVVRRIGHTDVVRRFVEQSTLVHELGHTIGLVDLGVPLTSTHEDPAHEHHCIFENCIMYWANEGAADLAQFVQRYAMTGDAVLFGQECLADVCEFGE